MRGAIYSETVVWSAPVELADAAPYQLVLVEREDGGRVMGRMAGEERVSIGDAVILDEAGNSSTPLFRKAK